jgi:hypothetical protein
LRLIDTPWLQIEAEQARILLHVQPGARRNNNIGLHDGMLKLRVVAAAIQWQGEYAGVPFGRRRIGAVTQLCKKVWA